MSHADESSRSSGGHAMATKDEIRTMGQCVHMKDGSIHVTSIDAARLNVWVPTTPLDTKERLYKLERTTEFRVVSQNAEPTGVGRSGDEEAQG